LRAYDDAGRGCHFVDVVLKNPKASAFHRVDVDNDGIPDMV
jgi:hypothetical protein